MKTIKNLTADELRKSILQLAIQGKLVKQNPNDEPASELVKKIYEEKKKLIAEGKIKKDKNESYIFKGDDNCYYEKIGKNEPVKLEDLPFDIPENWTWIKMESSSLIVVGATPSTSNSAYWNNGTIPWLPSGCCQDCEVYDTYPKIKYITESGYNSCSTTIMKKNTVLIALTGATAGKVGILKFEACANQSVVGISPYYGINTRFMFLQLMARRDEILADCVGSAQPHISKEYVTKMYFALPPLEEQQRIVDKINSFEPLLQEYEGYEKKLTELESTFADKLKKSILQYAIEGKLVKQDPNDEPASVLLERIKAEKEKLIKEGKIKRDKNESYIYQGDDKNYYENIDNKTIQVDIPFDIPGAWKWIKSKMILSKIQYGFNGAGQKEGKIKLLRITDIQNNAVNWHTLPYCAIDSQQELDYQIHKYDIYIARTGGTIGKSFWLNEYKDNTVFAGYLIRFQFIDFSLSKYISCYLNSPLYWAQVADKSAGTGQPNINSVSLGNLLIPLPPINEQFRICRKIDIINRYL